jgi:hypothetical protein
MKVSLSTLTTDLGWNVLDDVKPILDPVRLLHSPRCGSTLANIANHVNSHVPSAYTVIMRSWFSSSNRQTMWIGRPFLLGPSSRYLGPRTSAVSFFWISF